MSVESGWGSSAWGLGKFGQESNEDLSATINGVSTITANATEASGASATINGAATITAVVGEVHFAQTQSMANALWQRVRDTFGNRKPEQPPSGRNKSPKRRK